MAKTEEELNRLKIEYETLNNKLKELTQEELNLVVGGSGTRREKTIVVPVGLPSNLSNKYLVSVYIDGIPQSSMTKELDPCIESINLSFKGISGLKTVCIKIDNVVYMTYQLNFDDESYCVI